MPALYLNMEVLRVKREVLGVMRKLVQLTNDWLKTSLAGVIWKVKVIVSQMSGYMMVPTSAKVTEDAK